MSAPERFARLSTLFDELVDLTASERARQMAIVQSREPELVEELRQWLRADDQVEAGTDVAREIVEQRLVSFGGLVQPGSAIGRYTVLEIVGEGGMGTVYAVYDARLDRRIALKLVHGGHSQSSHRRMLREAQAMAKLSHPNVVPVFEVGEHDGELFVTMEYVLGDTLDLWCAEAKDWRDILGAFIQAGRGLAAAHEAGIVHRDFKPRNAVVGKDRRVRVLDFGLAARPGAQPDTTSPATPPSATPLDTPVTETGAVLGTPAYMSPEQFRGGEVDARSDQFSFCVAAWEALYGARPFVGDTPAQVFAAVMQGELPDASAPGVPVAVRRLLGRGLSVDPESRWPRLHELIEQLEYESVDRGPVRRRRFIAGAAVLLGVGAAVSTPAIRRALRARDAERCERQAAEATAEFWNDEARELLSSALRGMGTPIAAETAERTTARLDEYADQWSQVHRDVCTAESVETSEVVERAWWCLEEQTIAFSAYVARMRTADASALPSMVDTVLDLRPPTRCGDPDQLPRLPDAASRELAAESNRQYAAAKASHALGDVRPALAQVLEVAQTADSRRLRGLAAAFAGNMKFQLAEYEEGRSHLENGYFIAIDEEDYSTAAFAAESLAFGIGYHLHEIDEAVLWDRHAQAALGKAGVRPDDPRNAQRMHKLAVVYDSAGDQARASELLQDALDVLESTLGAEAPLVGEVLNSLGVVMARMGDLDRAREIWERTLSIRRATFGPRHPNVALTLQNLSGAYAGLGQLDEAVSGATKALEIRRVVYGDAHPDVAYALGNLGSIYTMQRKFGEAEAVLRESMAVFQAAHGPEHRDVAAAMIALAQVLLQGGGDHEEAFGYLREAVRITEAALGPDHAQLAEVLGNVGALYAAAKRSADAEPLLERAVVLTQKIRGPEHMQVGHRLTELGWARLGVGKREEALAAFERAHEISAAHGGTDPKAPSTNFGLATALVGQPSEHARAVALAQDALAGFRVQQNQERVDTVTAWLAEHGAGTEHAD